MRINDSYNKLAVEPVKASSPNATISQTSDAKGAVQVTVSAQARALAERPPVDLDDVKVSRLRSALQAGAFNIDSATIAARIVEGD